jgi:hypothetical protein
LKTQVGNLAFTNGFVDLRPSLKSSRAISFRKGNRRFMSRYCFRFRGPFGLPLSVLHIPLFGYRPYQKQPLAGVCRPQSCGRHPDKNSNCNYRPP